MAIQIPVPLVAGASAANRPALPIGPGRGQFERRGEAERAECGTIGDSFLPVPGVKSQLGRRTDGHRRPPWTDVRPEGERRCEVTSPTGPLGGMWHFDRRRAGMLVRLLL